MAGSASVTTDTVFHITSDIYYNNYNTSFYELILEMFFFLIYILYIHIATFDPDPTVNPLGVSH